MASQKRINEYFSYTYPNALVDIINKARDRIMGSMPERSNMIGDEVHTTSVFVGSDRHLNEEERKEIHDELTTIFGGNPVSFKINGVCRGEKPVIMLELEEVDDHSKRTYLDSYRAIFKLLTTKGFPHNMSFSTPDTPPKRHITLSWVPEDRVDEYVQMFKEDEGIAGLKDLVLTTTSFRLVHNDGEVMDTYYHNGDASPTA